MDDHKALAEKALNAIQQRSVTFAAQTNNGLNRSRRDMHDQSCKHHNVATELVQSAIHDRSYSREHSAPHSYSTS